VLLVVAALWAMALVFNPWIFLVGGRTRLMPIWGGSGEVHTQAGAYRVYVWFSPSRRGSRTYPGVSVSGSGYVCTPRGERYSLSVTGGASGQIWKDMDGHSFHLDARHRPAWRDFTGAPVQPRLSFTGQWVQDTLVMTDDASFAHAFLPDGSLNTRDQGNWHPKTGALPITFTEIEWSWTGPGCRTGG
jgi:hypothetical protein